MRRSFQILLVALLIPVACFAQDPVFSFLKIYRNFLENGKITTKECLTLGKSCLGEKDTHLCEIAVSLCYRSGLKREALIVAQDAVQEIPNSSKLWFLLGKMLLLNNRSKDAEQALSKAIQIDPQTKGAYEILIRLYILQGKNKKALRLIKEMEKHFPNSPEVPFLKGKVFYSTGNYTEAMKLLNKALELQPDNTEAVKLLADIYFKEGMYQKASSLYEKLISRGIMGEKIIKRLIDSYIGSSQYKKAIHILERLYRIHRNHQVANVLAILYLKAKELESARKLCKEEKEASACVALSCIDGRKFLNLKTDYSTYVEAGRILYELGNFRCALKMFQLASFLRPKNAIIYSYMAQVQSKLGNVDAALKDIDTAIVLDPENDSYHFQKGVILERNGRIKEAISALEKAIKLNPESATYLNYLGYLLIVRDINVDRGIELVKKALEIAPDNPAYLDSLAWGLFKKGKYQKALKVQQKVIEKNRNSAVILFHYAEILYKLNRKQEAIKYYKKCRDLIDKEEGLSPWEKQEIEKRLKQLGF